MSKVREYTYRTEDGSRVEFIEGHFSGTGLQGPTGPTGLIGPQGAQGATGPTGPVGGTTGLSSTYAKFTFPTVEIGGGPLSHPLVWVSSTNSLFYTVDNTQIVLNFGDLSGLLFYITAQIRTWPTYDCRLRLTDGTTTFSQTQAGNDTSQYTTITASGVIRYEDDDPAYWECWFDRLDEEDYGYLPAEGWIEVGVLAPGEVGPIGPEGPTGATGATGATGPTGPEGPSRTFNQYQKIYLGGA